MTPQIYRAADAGQSATALHYEEFQSAFEFFNRELFKGELPDCLIVMTRNPRSHGYLASNRWYSARTGGTLHELSLNPVDFAIRSAEEVLSTLVHEMCHAWQCSYGEKVPRKSYHNREWADRMEEIGLIPSNTGEPGGKRTGQSVSHYIDEDGPFAERAATLLDIGWAIPHIDLPMEESKKTARPKYVCPQCGNKVWGKSGLSLACLSCEKALAEQTAEDEEDQATDGENDA